MRTAPVLCVLASLAFVHAARAADDPLRAALPAATTARLSNGLTLLLAPDPRARLVSLSLSYRVGSADDPNGRRGLAHLVEHMTMLRTAQGDRPMRVLESIGASRFNAVTTPDATTYFETVTPERLENAMWLTGEMMGDPPDLHGADLAEEAKVVDNEDVGKMQDRASVSVTASQHAVYPAWHPYSNAADGSADLGSISLQDEVAFRAAWYTPRNATLAIAGRFDPEAAIAAAKRYLEPIASTEPPVRPKLPDLVVPPTRTEVAAPVVAPQVTLVFRTPALGDVGDAALDFAATILAGRGNTRFQRALVSSGLASAVEARQMSMLRASVFRVTAIVAPGATVKRVEEALVQTIADVSRTVTDAELARAHAIWGSSIRSGLETTYGRAARMGMLAKWGRLPRDRDPFDWDLDRYDAVTREAVRGALTRWLDPAHRVVVIVLPDRTAPLSGVVTAHTEGP